MLRLKTKTKKYKTIKKLITNARLSCNCCCRLWRVLKLKVIMEIEIKKIVIKQEVNEDGTKTSFKVDGFSDFEVMGLLSYYNDAFKIGCLKNASKNSSIETES
jgi:hypothetical protein